MSARLPRLRMNLDFMPSPAPERPGLLLRDPHNYAGATLIVPPPLVACLRLFDGESTELDLRELLTRITGDIAVGDLQQHLTESLSAAGFLEDETYEQMRDARHREFAESPIREAAHAGVAYPGEPEALRAQFASRLPAPATTRDGLLGIAAPHVSPDGGWESYAAAYGSLGAELRDRVFVILGTSHYGEPDRFGLTRKPFRTPYGEARTEVALVNRLAERAPEAVQMEDYCHAAEHSVEFQVVFLQHLYGPEIRILPILCGAHSEGLSGPGLPEASGNVTRFIGALGELAAQEGKKLFWVLGVDMAHMGRRYGDGFPARADQGPMGQVAARDNQRIQQINRGDAAGFWELVKENRDDLKWCGSAPIYTFLRAVPEARGRLLHYQQWNIDEHSVVSFGAIAFRAGQPMH